MKKKASPRIMNTHRVEHIIIGTAGHIDHGKTALVKALTGIDADRLPEEKQRGMTIDLGFAYIDLDGNQRVSIIDVPGHERFVKNMLAGATSIDLVLFVIAADDGIMPQTVEHLEIINLLGIKYGLIAITKKDLVTNDLLEVVKEDIKKLLSNTTLESAPIIPVSVVTGEGIEVCRNTIKELIGRIKTHENNRIFRMAIDRSFTISGYGCVVTGPILGGQISVDDEVEILPIKRTLRIRGIEITGERVNTAFAGQRAAINLIGIKSSEIQRGFELSIKGYLQPVNIVDATLRLIKNARNPLKNRSRIRFHINTSEVIGRVILLDSDILKPEDTSFVQFLLESAITVERDDRFIIRSYSPAYTIGGGKILRYNETRLKRFKDELLKPLNILASGNLFDIVEQVYLNNVVRRGERLFAPTIDDISRQVNIHPSIAEKIIADLVKEGVLMKFSVEGKNVILHKIHVLSLKERILKLIEAFHKENPLKTGIEEAYIKALLGKDIDSLLIAASLNDLKKEKAINIIDNKLSLSNFRIKVTTQESEITNRIEDLYLKAGFTPPPAEEVSTKFGSSSKSYVSLLLEQKKLIKVEGDLYFHASSVDKLKEMIKIFISSHGSITVAQFRDLTKTSRKYAVPLLEYFDAIHFTKRTGDVRILL
ncbi:MAG TPA: selenocysteine-specific translation elongation factor [Candidatus Wujingus californicus]|uniref:selenocysteine-specific translation elongation factor n=1 Tax=Candidatus Wujingus californicus TaxID=3367618 RepID=UPI0040250C4F